MWIKDFLRNRYQRVVYKGSVSTPAKVVSGITQGSAISSLLFTVYISDLAEVVELCGLILFADDSKAAGPTRKHNRIQIKSNQIFISHKCRTSHAHNMLKARPLR